VARTTNETMKTPINGLPQPRCQPARSSSVGRMVPR
jgi:hypothetical protein